MKATTLILFLLLFVNASKILAQSKDDPYNSKDEMAKMLIARANAFNSLVGQELPHFELELVNGTILQSESLKGKPTVINFWFIYCAPCIEEMPILNAVKKEFGDKVNFVAITYHNEKEIHEFLDYTDFDFIHAANAADYIKTIGMNGYPKTLILDENLVIKSIHKGIPKDAAMKKENKENFKYQLINELKELIKN